MKKKKFLFENLGLKIAAVILSIILWIYVTSLGQSESSIDVPLEFINIPPKLEIVNKSMKSVSLHIRGQENIIRNISPSDIRVSIDLSKTRRGENIYYITRDDIKLPRMLTVTNISPSSVKITTEETISKTVKVIPVIIGQVKKGFYVKSIEVVPKTAVIEGIRSEIIKVNSLRTETLDISGIDSTITQDLKLDLKGKRVQLKIDFFKVTVEVSKKRA